MKKIFLLEDNDDDAFLTVRALTKAGIICEVERHEDGEAMIECLSKFSKEDITSDSIFPYLLLLDLKTPKKTGLEVLQWIRGDSLLHLMVVLALTSSSERKDAKRASELHVNAYLVKPTSLSNMTDLAMCIKKIWLDPASGLQSAHLSTLLSEDITPPAKP
ncbi:MAG: response regulator [Blastochloris sp.]|nr:response regulator [Blastochloris sp.]